MPAREINVFSMTEPFGEREPGDFRVYPTPADAEVAKTEDPKDSAEPVGESSKSPEPQVPPAPPIPPALALVNPNGS